MLNSLLLFLLSFANSAKDEANQLVPGSMIGNDGSEYRLDRVIHLIAPLPSKNIFQDDAMSAYSSIVADRAFLLTGLESMPFIGQETRTLAPIGDLIALSEAIDFENEEFHFYKLSHPFSKGSVGEIWLGSRKIETNRYESGFVLKRIKNPESRISGLREVYFAQKLGQHDHIVDFIEYFEAGKELWIVFKYAGKSLSSLLYENSKSEVNAMLFPSPFWHQLKKESNSITMVRIVSALLKALDACHKLKITHRDIKPSNILIDKGRIVIADFGSAVDEKALYMFYSIFGPSQAEETLKYAPPEVLFGSAPYFAPDPMTYDLWSVGTVFLELILGSPRFFEVSQRARAMIELKMENQPDELIEQACLFRAFVE